MEDEVVYKNCRIKATPKAANAPMDEWYPCAHIALPSGETKDIISRGTMISGRETAAIESIEIAKTEIDRKQYG